MVRAAPIPHPEGPRAESPLARLHALEWRYDGPVPAAALRALDATPAELARREQAADSVLIDRLARDAVRTLAAARHRAAVPELHRLGRHGAAARLAACRRTGLALLDESAPPG